MSQEEAGAPAASRRRATGPPAKPATRLAAGQSAASALAELVERNYAVLLANEASVRTGAAREPLHDLRVSLRRLRALLRSARSWIDEAAPELGGDRTEVRAGLGWLSRCTGELRDLDVLLLWLGDAADTPPALLACFEQRRAAARERLAEILGSSRQLALHASVAALCAKARSLPARPDLPTAASWAARGTRRAGRRLLVDAAALSQPSASSAALHRVRIEAKRLRYLLELFGSLYEPDALSGLLEMLAQLQQELGGLQDAEVQLRLLSEVSSDLSGSARERCSRRARRRRRAALAAWQRIEPSALRERLERLTRDADSG